MMLDERTYRFACKAIRLRFQDMARQLSDADNLSWKTQSVLDVSNSRFKSIVTLLKAINALDFKEKLDPNDPLGVSH